MSGLRSVTSNWFLMAVLGASGILAVSKPVLEGQPPAASASGLPSTAEWGRTLERHVLDGGVDYASLAGDRAELDTFVRLIAGSDLEAASAEEVTAFWINAYNAVVLYSVLERYPAIESVMDVDGFFDQHSFEVAGERLTLDEIEKQALASGDPRVHFAVVCAAQSCPSLRAEAYTGKELDLQLADQTRTFLADVSKGARLDVETGTLWLSALFKWYGGDFTAGSDAAAYVFRGRLSDWVEPHLPPAMRDAIAAHPPSVRFLEYDWSLNNR